MNQPFDLTGKVYIVTGSGKGIGKGIVRCFVKSGAKCCINCNSNAAMAQEALQEIQAIGGEDCALVYQADVSDYKQAEAMVKATYERYGRIDGLVNNAALQKQLPMDLYTLDGYDQRRIPIQFTRVITEAQRIQQIVAGRLFAAQKFQHNINFRIAQHILHIGGQNTFGKIDAARLVYIAYQHLAHFKAQTGAVVNIAGKVVQQPPYAAAHIAAAQKTDFDDLAHEDHPFVY